jgi:hypothetical protein
MKEFWPRNFSCYWQTNKLDTCIQWATAVRLINYVIIWQPPVLMIIIIIIINCNWVFTRWQ